MCRDLGSVVCRVVAMRVILFLPLVWAFCTNLSVAGSSHYLDVLSCLVFLPVVCVDILMLMCLALIRR
jgi:hypothetical protein